MNTPVKPFKKFLLVLLGAILFITAGCGGKSASQAQPTEDTSNLPPVKKSAGITAEAQVVPIRSVILSFTVPGVVDEIMVKEGELVQEGQIIARLSGKEKLESAVAAAEMALVQAQQNLKTLNEKAALAKSNAELALARAQISLTDALDDREKLGYKRASQSTIDELRAVFVLAQQALDDAEDTYSWVQDAPEDDTNRAYALIQLSRTRKARDKSLENLNYAMGQPDKEDIAEADAKIEVARQQVADSQRTLDGLKNGPDPDDLQLVEAQIKNSEAQLAAARNALDDIDLKAPFGGTIATNNLEVGAYVGPGVPAIELGDLSTWRVETTDLTELDVVGIAPGDLVTVEFDALPDLQLPGTVEKIKPRGQNTRGDITYVVVVDLSEQDDRLLWAMSAVVKFEVK